MNGTELLAGYRELSDWIATKQKTADAADKTMLLRLQAVLDMAGDIAVAEITGYEDKDLWDLSIELHDYLSENVTRSE